MEVKSLKITTKGRQDVHLTVYSDLHLGSSSCDETALRTHMDERASLPNSVFIGLGDLGDFILPSDQKRFVLGGNSRAELNVAGYTTAVEESVRKFIKPYRWGMFGMGNHCLSVLKHHSVNPMANLANKMGVLYGGYCGFLKLEFETRNSKGSRGHCDSVIMLYHHGGGGGSVTKGLPWAKRFASGFAGWDVFCFGHNHQAQIHHETTLRPTDLGKLESQDRYLVNTGTFLQTYSNGGDCPSYGEVSGMSPVALTAPTIRVRPRVNGGNPRQLQVYF